MVSLIQLASEKLHFSLQFTFEPDIIRFNGSAQSIGAFAADDEEAIEA